MFSKKAIRDFATTFVFARIFSWGIVAQGSLIGFYPFNGNANDSSGAGNNGVVHGSVTYTNNGPFGGLALTLNGTNRGNYVTVPIDSSVGGQPTETIGGWFRARRS